MNFRLRNAALVAAVSLSAVFARPAHAQAPLPLEPNCSKPGPHRMYLPMWSAPVSKAPARVAYCVRVAPVDLTRTQVGKINSEIAAWWGITDTVRLSSFTDDAGVKWYRAQAGPADNVRTLYNRTTRQFWTTIVSNGAAKTSGVSALVFVQEFETEAE